MSVDRGSDRPVYRQVADVLRAAIRTGELVAGQSLPPETELMQRYGVSRNSVRTAVGLLRVEGLVVTVQGRGSFVRARRPLRRLGSSRHLQADEGGGADDRLLGVEVTDPPAEVAERLGLVPDELVLVRRHLLSGGGEPAGLAHRYFPLRVAQPTVGQAERIARAAPAEAERVVEELTLRMPSPDEARQLGISGGVPVVRLLRTSYDASAGVVEVAELVLAGDRHVLVYEVPAH
ncbi:MAG: GntR family transcriptional regulator [Egibacteraceae bacterium]